MRSLTLAAFVAFSGSVNAQAVALLLFGGDDHKTFLGCLNCGQYDSGSICNKYGEYGSQYATDSIWNRYGTYGSQYNTSSPWNKYSSQAPAIVDKNGNFYGYMSANPYLPRRTQIKSIVALTNASDQVSEDPEAVSDAFCGR